MSAWRKDIGNAPRDGSTILVKRVYRRRVIYEGPAAWRTVHFGALYDPLTGECFFKGGDETGWMRVDSEHRVPTPTHWKPQS